MVNEIKFELNTPLSVTESDFNSLVLRMKNLKDFIDNQPRDKISVYSNNFMIEEMKNLLDNFIIKEIDEVK